MSTSVTSLWTPKSMDIDWPKPLKQFWSQSQGSHRDWKPWKTFEKSWKSHGKVMQQDNQQWNFCPLIFPNVCLFCTLRHFKELARTTSVSVCVWGGGEAGGRVNVKPMNKT